MHDDLKTKLAALGLSNEQMDKLALQGVASETDMSMLNEAEVLNLTGCGLVTAKKVAAAFASAPVAAPTNTTAADPNAELPEGAKPTTAQVAGLASTLGVGSDVLMMMFASGSAGMGSEMDISGMIPIRGIVDGYNPKVRNMFLMIMGQLENRLGVPVVVINNDGSVNKDLTVEYIEGLEEGRDPAENNIYFNSDGSPHEVIRVGVDAQSIYDADPLDSTKALQKNGMGTGRINWHNVPLEVRQVVFFATKTGELSANSDANLSWLRDHVKPSATRLMFHGQAPKAIAQYNEAARTGSLPTLRVMLSRSPRRKEMMPRRRSAGIGAGLLQDS